jgi:hypothetical protein
VFCQYRLTDRAAAGDAAACALLGNVLRWAAEPRPAMARRDSVGSDGRRVLTYSWADEVAR